MKNNKSLGQHWLKDRAILDAIADLSCEKVAPGSLCLEIGPGLGTLTSSLLKRFSKVIAVEFDQRLAENLPKSFPNTNLEVINDDILRVDISHLVRQNPYVVVGNIPYYITSPIIRQLLSIVPKPQKIVLLIQREVAERIATEPGAHSYLSLMVQNQAEVELGPIVKAEQFTPPPKVDSQVVILVPLKNQVISDEAMKLAKRGFSNPRKKLIHNLAGFGLSKLEWQKVFAEHQINPNARAEDLELLDWEDLQSVVKSEKVLAKS